MTPVQETDIREQAANLALKWREQTVGPFTGESKEELADMIVAAYLASDESRWSLHRWIDAGRRAGLSWTEIGGLIGVSKQAAQQRFGSPGASPDMEDGTVSVRLGATAFNEMQILQQEGERKRELLGTGLLSLKFRQTEQIWEYKRTAGAQALTEQLAGQGWSYVSSWFVFHYFKRPAVL